MNDFSSILSHWISLVTGWGARGRVFILLGVLAMASGSVVMAEELAVDGGQPGTTEKSGAAKPPVFDRQEQGPKAMEQEQSGVVEKLGQQVPLDVTLTDETGKTVRLGDYVRGDKPVILNLAYYGCPMLCGLIFNGMIDSFKELSFTPGQEFRVVTVSFDPAESHFLAMEKKRSVMETLGKPGAAAGWFFHVGQEKETRRLAEAVGFNYYWDTRQLQWAHPATLILLTPDGKISRYLAGIQFPEKVLRLSLVEASQGKIGSWADQAFLTCFDYDPAKSQYTLAARRLMQMAAVLTVIILGIVIGRAFYRERQRIRNEKSTFAPA